MKYAIRAATAAAAIAAFGVFAGPASAQTPKPSYYDELVDNLDAANSYETVRHLAEDIGGRFSGTRQEDQAAEWLQQQMDAFGYQTKINQYHGPSTTSSGVVRSLDKKLYPGPTWIMRAASNSKMTGYDTPLSGEVIWIDNSGASAADFPASTAGKIAAVNNVTGTARDTAVVNAVAAGATGVIIMGTGASASSAFSLGATAAAAAATIPVVASADVHSDTIKELVCAPGPDGSVFDPHPGGTVGPTQNGPWCADQKKLTLTIATETVTANPAATVDAPGLATRAVITAQKKAVSDVFETAPIVGMGGHIDSVFSSPGAHDDATGEGIWLEVARIMKDVPLDKEIRFGGFGGEEQGLTGSTAWANEHLYVSTDHDNNPLTPNQVATPRTRSAEAERYIGQWQMDMTGTTYAPARLWALTVDGNPNRVTDEAFKAAQRSGITTGPGGYFDQCKLSQSDHVPFHNAGIPAALFIHLDYRKSADGRCNTGSGSNCSGCSYQTEPAYHNARDAMDNVSQVHLQEQLDIIGASYIWNALNKVDVNVTDGSGQPVADASVKADCGDGVRDFGATNGDGYLEVRVPHVTCDFSIGKGNAAAAAAGVEVHGDQALALSLTSADGSASGTVGATLSLTLGAPATFGAFIPGVANTYTAATTANVISTAGDALLSVSDPSSTATGHLVNGAFSLPQALQARARNAGNTGTAYNNVGSSLNLLSYDGPVSNDQVALQFSQAIGAGDALRTGVYSKTLTFTLSTTNP
ncbi:MAG TPA: M28 family peptidase [Solirubrobacter sp.]|nr:M28 family peptidase [Solirubrobacter sp.]